MTPRSCGCGNYTNDIKHLGARLSWHASCLSYPMARGVTRAVSYMGEVVMKRVELLAVVLACMVLTYMVGYYDGAHTRHHTIAAEVSP